MPPTAKVQFRRRIVLGLVISVGLMGVLFFAVFPTQSWWAQRRETSTASQELRALQDQRAKVEAEQVKLRTPEEIERRAKEELGYVNPGEELYPILPAPVDPIGLPEGWPFTGVERAFGAR